MCNFICEYYIFRKCPYFNSCLLLFPFILILDRQIPGSKSLQNSWTIRRHYFQANHSFNENCAHCPSLFFFLDLHKWIYFQTELNRAWKQGRYQFWKQGCQRFWNCYYFDHCVMFRGLFDRVPKSQHSKQSFWLFEKVLKMLSQNLKFQVQFRQQSFLPSLGVLRVLGVL